MKVNDDDLNDFFSKKVKDYKEFSDQVKEIKVHFSKVKFLQTPNSAAQDHEVAVLAAAAFDGEPNVTAGKIDPKVLMDFLEEDDDEENEDVG